MTYELNIYIKPFLLGRHQLYMFFCPSPPMSYITLYIVINFLLNVHPHICLCVPPFCICYIYIYFPFPKYLFVVIISKPKILKRYTPKPFQIDFLISYCNKVSIYKAGNVAVFVPTLSHPCPSLSFQEYGIS